MRKKQKQQLKKYIISIIVILIIGIIGYFSTDIQYYICNFLGIEISEDAENVENTKNKSQSIKSFDLSSIPEYTDSSYVVLNENKPEFTQEDYTTDPFENYSNLDSLGRCGVAYANICKEIMPKEGEKRESIGNIKPSGWQTIRYNGVVDGNYLYNRSHLIGWQLSGENSNKLNLITGTRYMNVEGMLPFENLVDDYFEKEENENKHVLYRVTPIYIGNNLLASGVQIEAYSVEDNGEGICFNVYVYNVQPGIEIDYATGKSRLVTDKN